MTIKAEALDALLAAGATAEMIVALVKADGFGEEKRLAKKREGTAERVRRYRERHAAADSVTQCNARNALHPLQGERSYLREEEVSKEEDKKESKKERKSGNQLPDDWVPSSGDVEYGGALGLSESQISGSAEDLRLWAAANANRAVGRKSNWSATFKGWMRRVAEKQAARQQPLSLREEKQERWHAAIAKVREFANRAEEGGESGGEIIRLLPALGGKQ